MTGSPSPHPDAAPRRALITGATGFVGRHLCRRLVDDGWAVTALVRDPGSPRVPRGVDAVSVPGDHAAFVELIRRAEPEVCLHLATHFVAEHRPDDVVALIEANVTLGTRLADALVEAGGIPLVNTGTAWQHVAGADYDPVSLYAATKQALTDILRYHAGRRGLPVVTLTLADTYGPEDDRPKLVPALLAAAREGRSLDMSDGGQMLDLVHIDDVAAAFLVVIDLLRDDRSVVAGDGTTRWAVSSDRPVTLLDLIPRFSAATGLDLKANWGVRPRRLVEMREPWPSVAPPPGWSPAVSLDDGLAALVAG
jgi:nucleoside-diphosphate-sugar epimerase